VTDGHARTPAEREHKREACAAVQRLLIQLHERLPSYGVRQPVRDTGVEA
jgi:hypothetical protein